VKIALVGPVYPYRGGIAHYTSLLARALRRRGHEVLVVSFRRQYPQWLYPGKSDRDPSQKAIQIEAEFILDPLSPFSWRQTWRRISAFAPQQVVINWWTTFWGPAFASLAGRLRKSGLPVTFLIHNVMPHESKPWDRWLALRTLRSGSAFIVQTEGEHQRLLDLLPQAHAVLTPHPIYDMFAGQPQDPAAARQQLGLPAASSVLLFFGIVRRYKGLSVLLQAMAQPVLASLQPFLVIAGEFWEDKSQYQEQAQALGLSRQLRIEDRYIPNEEIPLFFSAADLLVAPYTGGTQSGAVKMAMGFGLPAVVSQHLADEMIRSRSNESVFMAESGDPTSLAQAISRALKSPRTPPAAPPGEDGWSSLVKVLEQCV
jgi:glycosyltransferase involved in cell wall biosynthesis